MSDETVIGAFNDFEGFQLLLRERREELKMSLATLDARMKANEGHAGKMLADPPTKNMGITSFGKLMKNLAVKGVLVVDETQMQRITEGLECRDERQVRTADTESVIILRFTKRHMRKLSRLAAQSRKGFSKAKRKAMTRAARQARWGGKRA